MSQPTITAAELAEPPTVPPTATGAAMHDPMRPFVPLLWWLAFVAIALLANSGALGGAGFLWTDRALVQDNSLLRSLGGVQRIWAGLFDPSSVRLSQYSPLSQATFYLDRMIWGDHVGGYRLTSCLLHATTGLMLWYLLRRLALPGAIVVALLFVAHPMSVESVALLTERRTILATFFALSGAFLLLRALGVIAPVAGKRSALPDDPARLYALAATLFVIGLFAHAAIAFVPAIVLLLAWWRRRPIDSMAVGVCVGLVIAGVAMLSLGSRIERANTDVPAEQWRRGETAAAELAVRTQVAGRAVGFYAAKLAIPFPLMSDYPRWRTPVDVAIRRQFLTPEDLSPDQPTTAPVDSAATAPTADSTTAPTTNPSEVVAPRRKPRVVLEPDISPGSVLDWVLPVAVVVVLGGLLAASPRIGRGPFVAAASFVLCLLPLLGFVDLGWMSNSFVADRAAYLASIPFLAGIVALLAPVLMAPAQRTTTLWTVAVVLVAYLAVAASVSRRYVNAAAFWQAAANVNRGNPRSVAAQLGFAEVALAGPKPSLRLAALALENARFQRPGDPTVHIRIADLLARLGDFGQAINKYAFVMDHFPDDARAPLHAGHMFRYQADQKPTDPTLRRYTLNYYRTAAQRDPRNADAQAWLGVTAYEVVARLPDRDPQIPDLLEETRSAFNESVQADPYDPDRLVLMARTLIAMGALSDASNLLRSALILEPRRADAYELVGEAAILGGNTAGAEAAIRSSIGIDGENPATRLKLGSLLQATGRLGEAKGELQRVIELDPDNAEARQRLAEVEAGVSASKAVRGARRPSTTRATTAPATTRP